jgi:hypothetical protein
MPVYEITVKTTFVVEAPSRKAAVEFAKESIEAEAIGVEDFAFTAREQRDERQGDV